MSCSFQGSEEKTLSHRSTETHSHAAKQETNQESGLIHEHVVQEYKKEKICEIDNHTMLKNGNNEGVHLIHVYFAESKNQIHLEEALTETLLCSEKTIN